MSKEERKRSRLIAIAETCIKNHVVPDNTSFINIVNRVSCGLLLCSPNQAKQDAQILRLAYKADGWRSLLGKEEKPENKNTIQPSFSPACVVDVREQQRTEVKESLAKISTCVSEEIKRMPQVENTQPDNLTEEDKAKILYRLAQQDVNDGVGRLLLFDVRDRLDDKHLTMENIIELWQKHYPTITIDPKTSNVAHIYLEGKDKTLQQRKQREPIIPETLKNQVEE